jgi:hypothetical protein
MGTKKAKPRPPKKVFKPRRNVGVPGPGCEPVPAKYQPAHEKAKKKPKGR